MRTSAVRSRLRTNPLEEPPNEEKVIQALNVVYTASATQEQRDQAQNWLVSFRLTNEAWTIAVNLLQSNNVVVAHFATHTIQEKVKNQWNGLDQENQKVLFNILMNYFQLWSNGPNLLLTRLSLALSQIAIQVFPGQYPTFIDDILNLLNQTDKNMAKAVLTLLRVLPEEIEDAPITEERRNCLNRALRAEASKIIPLLVTFLDVNQVIEELKLSALKCLMNWKISTSQLVQTPLLDLVFECIRTYDSVVESGMEYLVAQLETSAIRNYPSLRTAFLKKFVSLEDRFIRSVRENNYSVALSMTQMFTNLGDLLCDVIINDKEYGPKLAMILARCGSHPDREISLASFRFWYELQTSLSDLDSDCEQRNWFVEPFLVMVKVLRDQCVYPADSSDWNKEQHQSFLAHRSEAADTLLYCYEFLRSKCNEVLWNLLQQDLNHKNHPRLWALVEATIFSFKATSEVVDQDDEYIPRVLACYPSFPPHTQLFQTALDFLGDISDCWIRHKDPTLYIPMVLNFIYQGLSRENSAEVCAAARALNQLSHSCTKYLKPHLEQIVQIIEPMLLRDKNQMETKSVLLESSVQILVECRTPQAAQIFFNLTNPIIGRVNILISQIQTEQTKMAILDELSILSHAFMIEYKNFEEETDLTIQKHFCGVTLMEPLKIFWPFLVQILQTYSRHDEIIHVSMKILKYALGNINSVSFNPLVPSFLEIVCGCYRLNPHEEILKTFCTAVTVHCECNGDCQIEKKTLFASAVNTLTIETISRIQELSFLPFVMKTFFETLSHVLKKIPDAIFGPSTETRNTTASATTATAASAATTENSDSAIQRRTDFLSAAIWTLPQVEDRLAHKSIINFIKEILYSNHPLCPPTVIKNVRPLLEVTYLSLGSVHTSRSMVPVYSLILMGLRDRYPNELRRVTAELFLCPSFPTANATQEIKKEFLRDLFIWRTKEFNDKLHSFVVLCRGLDLQFGVKSKPFL